MTIAELQLARMRPLLPARSALAERNRARRARVYNLVALTCLWAGLWLYAVGAYMGSSDPMVGLDRFLPLQLVAAIAALAVLLGRRSVRLRPWARRAALLPAVVTLVGALTLIWSIEGQQASVKHPRFADTESAASLQFSLVSL